MSDLISRQAAINVVAGIDRYFVKYIEALPSAQPEPRWIPCNERLPNEDYWTGAKLQYSADVLMTIYNAEDEETIIDYGHTVDGSWYSETMACLVPPWWEVLAWMPLPEPYKERTK